MMMEKNGKNNQVKISIIIPVYQVEQYLDKCIQSVINQTYQSLEIILVEDGSGDRCGAICDAYALADTRIRVIHKEHGGISEARNYGIDQATGEYIGFVDSDDWIEKDMYELLYLNAMQYRADIVICDFYTVKNNKVNLSGIVKHDIVYNREEALTELANDRITNHAWNKLYQRKLFTGIRFPVGMAFEDIATIYKLFAAASRIAYISAAKYYYLIRDTSITGEKVYHAHDYLQARRIQYEDMSKIIPEASSILYCNTVRSGICLYHQVLKQQGINKQYKQSILSEIKRLVKEKDFSVLNIKEKLQLRLSSVFPALYSLIYRIARVGIIKKKIYFLKDCYRSLKESILLNRNLNKTDPVIFLIGTPEHNNLGDQAIAYAETYYLKENFPDYRILELSENKLLLRMLLLKKNMKKSDIIAYHGGGNIGNQYLYYEKQRRWIIKHFAHNKIIILPQTIYFTKNKEGARQLQISCDRYNRHEKLIIAVRDLNSYNSVKYHFANALPLLVPDIVLFLNGIQSNNVRYGALLCFRDDVEKSITFEQEESITQCIMQHYLEVTYVDTCSEYTIMSSEREKALEAKWYQFQQAEIVITDRLHGMIFAALTGTPCIALNNYNYKIEGGYRWIKHLSYIRHIDHPEELEENLLQLRSLKTEDLHYENKQLKPLFHPIAYCMRTTAIEELAEQEKVYYGLR